MSKKFFYLFLLLLVPLINVSGQQLNSFTVVSAGDHFVGSGIEMSWSLGEIATESYSSGVILSQGFQQAYNRTTSIPEYTEAFNSLSVYPNPVQDHLNIVIHDEIIRFGATLVDLEGRVLYNSDQLTSSNTRVNMSDYTPGAYILYLNYEGIRKSYLIYKF